MYFPTNFLSNLYSNNWSSNFAALGQFFSIIAIFIFILFLTYYTTKFIANFKMKSTSKGNISIIETISIGTSHLHIIKVSNQHFLVSSSKDGFKFMTEIKDFEPQNISLTENSKQNFIEYFNKHLGKLKNKGGK